MKKLPEGWTEVEFQDIEDKNHPYPIGDGDHGKIKPEMYQTYGIPYIRVGDMVNDGISFENIVYISEKVHKDNIGKELVPGDVIIAKTGATIGKVAIIPPEIKRANTTASIGKITLNTKIALPKYILYFIKTHYFTSQMWSVSKKSAQPGFNILDIKAFKIPLPPLPIQQKIVSTLEKAEKAKEWRKEADELTHNYLKSVFMEMFGDKKKFEFKKILDICDVKSGGTPAREKKEYWQDGKIPWLGSTVCKDKHVNTSEQFITEEGLKNSSAKMFKQGTILVALVGATIGKTAYLNFDASTNQNIAGIYPKEKTNLNSEYLFYAIQNLYSQFLSLSSDTFKMATLSFVRNLEIPFPALPLQQKFASIVRYVGKMKEQQKNSKEYLDNLFNALTQKAFKGELVV